MEHTKDNIVMIVIYIWIVLGCLVNPVQLLGGTTLSERLSTANQIEIYDTVQIKVSEGWNLISLPLQVPDGSVKILFPNAISSAFIYDVSYEISDTLEFGKGYWLKFAANDSFTIIGTISEFSIDLKQGWNMIGSLNEKIAINRLEPNSCNIFSSNYYAYDSGLGYVQIDTLEPGKGYWLKVAQPGSLFERKWIKISDLCNAGVTVHPTEPNILYAGTYGYGYGAILKSIDWGATWDTLVRNVNGGIIVLDPNNPDICYASLGSGGGVLGVLKTTNGGATWFHADFGITFNWDEMSAGAIVIDPNNSEFLYTETYGYFGGGLRRSTNGGKSWFPIYVPSSDNCIIDTNYYESSPFAMAIDHQNSNILYACPLLYNDTVLYRSTDRGASWEIVHCFSKQEIGVINSIYVNSENSNIIYIGAEIFIRSTDQGQTWQTLSLGLPDSLLGVFILPSIDPNVMYVQTFEPGMIRSVYKTTNGGFNWYHVISDSGDTWILDLDETSGFIYSTKVHEYGYPPEIDGIYKLRICK
jgi:hypothetical protein